MHFRWDSSDEISQPIIMRFLAKQIGLWTGILAGLWLQPGCMTADKQLDQVAVMDKLQKGQTQQEVRGRFGMPKQSQTGSNGKSLDIFRVNLPKITAQPGSKSGTVEVRSLHVLYNPQAQVEDFIYYSGEAAVSSRLNQKWEAGRWFGPDALNKIQRGVTSRENLIQMFGRATVEGLDINGNKVMSWFFLEGQRGGVIRGREMAVLLDAKSLARDFGFRDIQP